MRKVIFLMSGLLGLVVASSGLNGPNTMITSAHASDEDVQNQLEAAQKIFAQRGSVEAPNAVEDTLKLLNGLDKQAEDADLKYDIFVQIARTYFWKGVHTASNEEKKVIFKAGMEGAAAAKALNSDYADAYYYYAINLGKWGVANGITDSLGKASELLENFKSAIEDKEGRKRFTRDGKPGETIDAYGPDRGLGRAYRKLPGLFGGSTEKSLEVLERANRLGSEYKLNTVYYSATLCSTAGLFSSGRKAEGLALLEKLVKAGPGPSDYFLYPENLDALRDAKQLLDKKGDDSWL